MKRAKDVLVSLGDWITERKGGVFDPDLMDRRIDRVNERLVELGYSGTVSRVGYRSRVMVEISVIEQLLRRGR